MCAGKSEVNFFLKSAIFRYIRVPYCYALSVYLHLEGELPMTFKNVLLIMFVSIFVAAFAACSAADPFECGCECQTCTDAGACNGVCDTGCTCTCHPLDCGCACAACKNAQSCDGGASCGVSCNCGCHPMAAIPAFTNSGFETGSVSTWLINGGRGLVTAFSDGHSGSRSFGFSGVAASTGQIFAATMVGNEGRKHLTFYMKVSSMSEPVAIVFSEDADAFSPTVPGFVLSGTLSDAPITMTDTSVNINLSGADIVATDWIKITASIPTGFQTASKKLAIRVAAGSYGIVSIDDIMFEDHRGP